MPKKYIISEETLIGMANAIRTKTGLTNKINVENYESEILSISDVNDIEIYDGVYQVVPNVFDNLILETKDKKMVDNVTVDKIPYAKVSNEAGGATVTIGETLMVYGMSLAFEE
jgi:hypothetical protein